MPESARAGDVPHPDRPHLQPVPDPPAETAATPDPPVGAAPTPEEMDTGPAADSGDTPTAGPEGQPPAEEAGSAPPVATESTATTRFLRESVQQRLQLPDPVDQRRPSAAELVRYARHSTSTPNSGLSRRLLQAHVYGVAIPTRVTLAYLDWTVERPLRCYPALGLLALLVLSLLQLLGALA